MRSSLVQSIDRTCSQSLPRCPSIKNGCCACGLARYVQPQNCLEVEKLTEGHRTTRHQSSKSASDAGISYEVRPCLHCCKNISSNYGPVLKVIALHCSRSPCSSRMGRVCGEISEISGYLHKVRGKATSLCPVKIYEWLSRTRISTRKQLEESSAAWIRKFRNR
jgi:hypothetical protein